MLIAALFDPVLGVKVVRRAWLGLVDGGFQFFEEGGGLTVFFVAGAGVGTRSAARPRLVRAAAAVGVVATAVI